MPPPRTTATRRTVGLSLLLATASLGTMLGLHPPGSGPMPVLLLAAMFSLSGLAILHFEFDEQAHTFSFSEIPLILGLVFAAPWALLLGRALGEAATMVLARRMSPVKVLFNVSMFMAETVVAIVVFAVAFGAPPVDSPFAWFAVMVAVLAAAVVGNVSVSLVIRWHNGAVSIRPTAAVAVASTLGNGSLAIVAALLAGHAPAALAVLSLLGVVVYLAYRGYTALSQRYNNLNLLYDFTDALAGAVAAQEVLSQVLTHAGRLLRAGSVQVVLLDEEQDTTTSWLQEEDRLVSRPADGATDALVRRALDTAGRLMIPRDSPDAQLRRMASAASMKDCIVVPLEEDGVGLGVIVVGERLADTSTFDADDLRLLETFANHASIALRNGSLIEQLRTEARRRQHQALHDGLTGLRNRVALAEDCASAIAAANGTATRLGFLIMDLDRFKDVNDTLGHHIGDELLQLVADRLDDLVEGVGTAYRLGGDEFGVLLTRTGSDEEILETASGLRRALGAPLTVAELDLVLDVSIGIAIWPEHGGDAGLLLTRADIAMYEAKLSHNRIEVYTPERDHHSTRRLTIAAALRQAIDDGDLELHYQPKVRAADGVVSGAEALVRWRHPELGLLSPVEFVPVAERTDLIRPLTEVVLRDAVRECRRWDSMGVPISVSVNIAARSLLDTGLYDVLVDQLAGGLDPAALILEITESGIMADPGRAIDMLDRIASLGVRLSVDDFGTGYSSLSYLQRLPVHEVKIDRSFVSELGTSANDAAIVRSIVELGHSLGLSVVAEGVEDRDGLLKLADLGCDLVQGYYVGRPLPAADFLTWLLRQADVQGWSHRVAPRPERRLEHILASDVE